MFIGILGVLILIIVVVIGIQSAKHYTLMNSHLLTIIYKLNGITSAVDYLTLRKKIKDKDSGFDPYEIAKNEKLQNPSKFRK